MELKINPRFKDALPALEIDEYQKLEKSVKTEGVRDSIIVWNGQIIDGHNRYRICQMNNIDFHIKEMNFESEDEAEQWIIDNQLARRNVNAYVRSELALKQKPRIAEKAKENQKTHNESGYQGLQNSAKAPIDTREKLAKLAGVSHDTIHKVEKIVEKGTDKQKEDLRKGEASINSVYNDIRREEFAARHPKTEKPKETVERLETQIKERQEKIEAGNVMSIADLQEQKKDRESLSKAKVEASVETIRELERDVEKIGKLTDGELLQLILATNSADTIPELELGLFQSKINSFETGTSRILNAMRTAIRRLKDECERKI